MRNTPSVSLNAHQKNVVDTLLRGGRYSTLSEVLREGLRLVERREAKYLAQVKALEKAYEEGLASGPDASLEPLDERLARYEKNRKARKKGK